MITRILHFAVYGFQTLRRAGWFFTRPATIGVHAIPLTPSGKIVLVTLSYAHGWRLPGGGKKSHEDHETACLRELREEIGMVDHQSVQSITRFEHRPDFRQGKATLFVVKGVEYRPRWSLEVKQVAEFDLHALPLETARITRDLIALAADQLKQTRPS